MDYKDKTQSPDAKELLTRFENKFVFRTEEPEDFSQLEMREISRKDNNPYRSVPCMSPLVEKDLEEGCPNFGGGNQEPMIPEERSKEARQRIRAKQNNALVEQALKDLTEPEPQPVENQLPYMWPKAIDRIIDIARQRDDFGAKKYGTRLQPFNGRDPLVDAFQEGLDKLVYIEQEIFERPYKNAVIEAAIALTFNMGGLDDQRLLQNLFEAVKNLTDIQSQRSNDEQANSNTSP